MRSLADPCSVLRRFDCDTDGRIGYVGAMTILEANNGAEEGELFEIAEAIEEHSAATSADLRECGDECVLAADRTQRPSAQPRLPATSTAGMRRLSRV